MMRLLELIWPKKVHVATHEAKAGSTAFLLSSVCLSLYPTLCSSIPDTRTFPLPRCPACRHREHWRNSSRVCRLLSCPFCMDGSSRVLVSQYSPSSTAPPTDVEASGLLGAEKSSGILVVNLQQVSKEIHIKGTY